MSRVVVSGGSIEEIVEKIVNDINLQLPDRAYRGANELRNSAISILRGQGGGRTYKVGGKSYTASAPGEVPAVRTGAFRASWQPHTYAFGNSYISRIKTGIFYAGWLEEGTPGGQMAPRPHHDKIQEHAKPSIIRIYDEPYV